MPDLRRLGAGLLTALLAAVVVWGVLSADPRPPDRVEALASRIRCPVCQGESVADSPSETARAMREVVAEQVAQGKSDREILSYFEARYGEWILLDAPPRGRTLPLWLVPVAAVLVGIGAIAGLRRPADEPR